MCILHTYFLLFNSSLFFLLCPYLLYTIYSLSGLYRRKNTHRSGLLFPWFIRCIYYAMLFLVIYSTLVLNLYDIKFVVYMYLNQPIFQIFFGNKSIRHFLLIFWFMDSQRILLETFASIPVKLHVRLKLACTLSTINCTHSLTRCTRRNSATPSSIHSQVLVLAEIERLKR